MFLKTSKQFFTIITTLVFIKSVTLYEPSHQNFSVDYGEDFESEGQTSENSDNFSHFMYAAEPITVGHRPMEEIDTFHEKEDLSVLEMVNVNPVNVDDDGTCEPEDSIKRQTSNLYPFVVIEPIVQLPDEFGNIYNSWCEGVMISDVWGLAPPNCFVKDETDYYLNLSEMTNLTTMHDNTRYRTRKNRSHSTRTFIAQLQVIIHNEIQYNFLTNTYCNYIALFKVLNFRFYFDFLIQLPKATYRGDLFYKMFDQYPIDISHPAYMPLSKTAQRHPPNYVQNDTPQFAQYPQFPQFPQSSSILDDSEKCKVIGAQFESEQILFTVGTFKLTTIHLYCTMFPLCSVLGCSSAFNYNLTYLDLNLPRSPAENGCSFDSGYHFGSLLICFDDDTFEWLLYGIATNEVVLSCSGANMYSTRGEPNGQTPHGFQAFTRIDAYIQWINYTVHMNGGWKAV